MTVSTFLGVVGGASIACAVVLSVFSKGRRLKIPAVGLGVIAGFLLGVGGGIALMGYYEKETNLPFGVGRWADDDRGGRRGGPGPGMGGGFGGGGMGGMMGFGGGGGGPRGPGPKTQLATLVAKLDQLTLKPLAVFIDDDKKPKIREHLAGLADLKELTDEDARKKLDALLDLVKSQRDVMEAAGYKWPTSDNANARPQLPPDEPENPFKEKDNGAHLDSLLRTVKEVREKI